jgi:glutamate--cysteine ligase
VDRGLNAFTEDEAAAFIGRASFVAGTSRRVGVELEWLVEPRATPVDQVRLPFGSLITREPGGQVELSSRPADDLPSCIAAVEADQAALEEALAVRGLRIKGGALDARKEPQRLTLHPRYRAMEFFFNREGPWGYTMMCSTASIQVNLDAGDDSDGPSGIAHRWHLAHRIGPVLVAAFANSPTLDGRPGGWKSARQAIWASTDPGRTRPMPDVADPRHGFAQFALDAQVMCVRRVRLGPWTAPPGLTLRSWIRDGIEGRRPTEDDILYHMSTLFPPVRPRGWLELRMIDQQEGDGWIVPAVVAATLLDDPACAAAAYEATEPLTGGRFQPPWPVWENAARFGLTDPHLHAVALDCFAAVADALRRTEAPPHLQVALADFRERYVDQGRCPADDRLDRARTEEPVPLAVETPS